MVAENIYLQCSATVLPSDTYWVRGPWILAWRLLASGNCKEFMSNLAVVSQANSYNDVTSCHLEGGVHHGSVRVLLPGVEHEVHAVADLGQGVDAALVPGTPSL